MGDERLAEEAGAGSERAFTTLFQRYHQQLYRYCRSLTGSDQDAQDALQTTFTKALIAMRQRRRNAPLRPWLYRIAHNESITLIRSRNTATGEAPLELAALHGVTDSAEVRERMAMLVSDLRELPEQQRGALVMRELSGLSHEEIAEALQLSVGAAKQSILEARRSLLEFAEGRAMTCEQIQLIISDDDRRSLRSRRVRAHMRDCSACAAFAAAIPRRRTDMLAMWPVLPTASAAGLLAKLTGVGSGHGGGGAGLAAGSALKGLGATISIKAAAATSAAVLATATVGAVAVLHRGSPATPGSSSHSPSVSNHRASGAGRGSGATRAAASVRSSTPNHQANGKGLGPAVGKRAAGQSSHGKETGSSGSGSGSPVNGHGSGRSKASSGTNNNGHSAARSATTTHHRPVRSVHRKRVKVNSSHKRTRVHVGHSKLELQRNTPATVVKTQTQTRATGVGETRTTAAPKTKTTATTTTASTVATATVTTTASTSASSLDSSAGNGGTPPGQAVTSASGKNSK
ncbi:MAG TPA: RNA polymerase sigma factor [Solirubrobacteraceae bacterium]|nr:RNA polymerase sigma factor [Solirubrobacteraceae bacterium]